MPLLTHRRCIIVPVFCRVLALEVAVNAGVVQLAGFVEDASSKSVASEVARAVDDVKSVENRIQVRQ